MGAELIALIGFLIAHEGDLEAVVRLISRALSGEQSAVERIDAILVGEGYSARALKVIGP